MFEKVVGNLRQLLKPSYLTDNEFARLYEKHIDAVFNFCLFRVSDYKTAEDLTAETFVRAWYHRGHYRPERASFATWLFTIARHLIIDHQRQYQRRPLTALDERQIDKEPSLEQQIEQRDQLAQLQVLVYTLGNNEQELIALKFGAGLTNRQIAHILNKSESAVGSALHRIMQRLRQQWKVSDMEERNA